MTSKEWLRIEALFHEALEQPEPERRAFLDAACSTDAQMREVVQSLIAVAIKDNTSFQQALLEAAETYREKPGQAMTGRTLGHYNVGALLGAGGMGEVYVARDTKLLRDVAIKILPAEFSRDQDRLNRFKQEAQVIASLNHPNIGAIHELGEFDGKRYLVLELVEGETLAERLKHGPLRLDDEIGRAHV